MKCHNLFVIFLAAFASCSTNQTVTEQKTADVPENVVTLTTTERKTAGMELGKPEKGLASSFLKVSGLVDVPPQNVVSVSFPIGGYLVSTRLLPGMRVRKGEAIAQMQDQSLIQMQQDYLVAKAKVGFLQKEYERQKLLNVTKTTSDKVLEQTQSEYQTQRILVSSLREKLRLVRIDAGSLNENNIRRSVAIYSPIDGYVSAVHVNIGKYVNPSDVLFELVNPNDLHLSIKVFEKDLSLLQPGQKVKVNLVNNPEKTYEAKVSLISKNLDNDRSAEVHCHFSNGTADLLPGMFANATIETKTTDAVTVPEDAVVRWGANHYLFVQKKADSFAMEEVTVGTTSNGRTEIRSAPEDLLGQTVISKNAYTALMKLQNKAE